MARNSNPWFGVGLEAMALGFEAASVIALRSIRLAEGGARAQAEAVRMVSEKAQAAAAISLLAATGSLGVTPANAARRTLRHYGRKVRANRRRLSKT